MKKNLKAAMVMIRVTTKLHQSAPIPTHQSLLTADGVRHLNVWLYSNLIKMTALQPNPRGVPLRFAHLRKLRFSDPNVIEVTH